MSTKQWLGNAVATFDLWTITLSGTVISQTYSMTINGKSLTYTASGSDTVAVILAALVNAWNASTITEFTELTAAAATSSTIVLNGNVAGVPAVVSVSTSGTATFSIAHTTPATGPNDFGNAQNWSGGVAPANSDTLVFDSGSTPCTHGLSTTLTGITLIVNPGYTGTIGKPFTNRSNSGNYTEYRTKYLTLAGGTAVINGPSVKMCNLAFGAHMAVVRVLATGQRNDSYTPPLLITGGDSSSSLEVVKGDVGVAFYQNETAEFPVIETAFFTNATTDVALYCGPGCTLTTVAKNGGNLTVNSAVAMLTQGVSGGSIVIADGAITTLNSSNGTVFYNSTGTLGTATLSGQSTLTFDQDSRAHTITNPILLYGDSSKVIDNQKTVNSGVLSITTNQTTKLNIEHGAGNVLSLT